MRQQLGLASALALIALHATLLSAALSVAPVLGFAALVAIWLLEAATYPLVDDRWLRMLRVVSAGLAWRVFVREVLLVVLVIRMGVLTATATGVVVAGVVGHHAIYGMFTAARSFVRTRRWRRVEVVNLPMGAGDALPPPPAEWLMLAGASALLASDATLIAALGWRVSGGGAQVFAPAAIATLVLAVCVALALAGQVVALLRLPDAEARLVAVQQSVRDLEPVVILYFSGGATSVYQVNMWFETMERLGRPVLVLLRERRYLAELASTTVPILCLPFTADLMNFQMPSARVALFVANVGRNIHLLREPGLKSAFIGHGDSDKTASFNPATKVYDEVWVAGEAGRQRYVRAQVGVRTEQIVLVGRPQLDVITESGTPARDGWFTVLYAPTWEGWVDDPHHTSLVSLGELIIGTLLATPGVRVLYKPHPLTGTVNPAARAADLRIAQVLRAAGEAHVVVDDNSRSLYDLFNQSDALISDVSSVVSDYLRSGKPYVVTNPAGLPDEVFRDRNAAAGAAYLVGPGASGLAAGLASARGPDELRARRAQVREYLLGDPAADSMTLFRSAVDGLVDQADRLAVPGMHGHGAEIDEPVTPAADEQAMGVVTAGDAIDQVDGAVTAGPA